MKRSFESVEGTIAKVFYDSKSDKIRIICRVSMCKILSSRDLNFKN